MDLYFLFIIQKVQHFYQFSTVWTIFSMQFFEEVILYNKADDEIHTEMKSTQ